MALIGCASRPKIPNDSGNAFFVLGSLHGKMLKHPHYNLRSFVDAMAAFDPDIILTETRPEHPGPENGSIDGGIEQSLIYAYSKVKGKQVVEVDWFDDDFLEKMQKEDSVPDAEFDRKSKPLEARYEMILKTGTFPEIQGQATQDLIRDIYSLQEKHGRMQSRRRNEKICINVDNAVRTMKGKRVLVIFGLDHKYFIDDHLSSKGNHLVPLKQFEQSIKPGSTSSELKVQALRNIESAENLLRSRLGGEYYRGAMKENLSKKLESFKNWREAVTTQL